MGDMMEEQGRETTVACPECQSQFVRPSQSSYPLDRARIGGNALSFWRCDNCGTRFLGSGGDEHRQRPRTAEPKDELGRSVQFGRWAKRWVFPTIAILLTILAVIYLLDRRNTMPTGDEGYVASPR